MGYLLSNNFKIGEWKKIFCPRNCFNGFSSKKLTQGWKGVDR